MQNAITDDILMKNIKSLQSKLNYEQQQASETRRLFLKYVDINNLSENEKENFYSIQELEIEYRNKQKEEKLRKCINDLNELRRKRRVINQLGGIVGKDLKSKIIELKNQIKEIQNSDPMFTDLY